MYNLNSTVYIILRHRGKFGNYYKFKASIAPVSKCHTAKNKCHRQFLKFTPSFHHRQICSRKEKRKQEFSSVK